MDLNGLSLFQQMDKKLHWLSARQTVLAENIANADTPHYRSRDLKPFSAELDGKVGLQRTDAKHLASNDASETPQAMRDKLVTETSPDGNQVSLEDQLTKVADTGMEYQMITNLYRKQLGMIKTALGRGATA